MAPARDLMLRDSILLDSILMVIVAAFVPLSRETGKLVRGMFAVARHARLGQLRKVEIHELQFFSVSHVGEHTGIVVKRFILLEKRRR